MSQLQLHSGDFFAVTLKATIVALSACVAACAQVETTMTEYPTSTRHSSREAAMVGVVHAEPSEPHDSLGKIVVTATLKPAPSEGRIESELRAAAATMGADAVVVVTDRTHQPLPHASQRWWTSSTQSEGNREVVGIAIKFR